MIILYDHVHPVGAFAKTSNIDVSTIHSTQGGGVRFRKGCSAQNWIFPCCSKELCQSLSCRELDIPQTFNSTHQRDVSQSRHVAVTWCLVCDCVYHFLCCDVVFTSVQIKASIKVLKDQPVGSVDGLLNALRLVEKSQSNRGYLLEPPLDWSKSGRG